MQAKLGSKVSGYKITKLLYTSGSVGVVYSAYDTCEREEKDNFIACKILADHLGWTCVLLPRKEGMGMKSADMMRLEDATIWEVKTNRTGSENSIATSMRRASCQSKRLVIRFDTKAIQQKTKVFNVKKAVRTVRRQMKHCGFKKAMVIFGDDKPILLIKNAPPRGGPIALCVVQMQAHNVVEGLIPHLGCYVCVPSHGNPQHLQRTYYRLNCKKVNTSNTPTPPQTVRKRTCQHTMVLYIAPTPPNQCYM